MFVARLLSNLGVVQGGAYTSCDFFALTAWASYGEAMHRAVAARL
jgi:hypothetical protein